MATSTPTGPIISSNGKVKVLANVQSDIKSGLIGEKSLKSQRTYQIGVILADIYGRQSPVLLPTTLSNSIITVPARGTAAEFNSWVGDNLKITFNAQSGKLIPDSNEYSNDLVQSAPGGTRIHTSYEG